MSRPLALALALALSLLAIRIWAQPPVPSPSGCCKERESDRDMWRRTDKSFELCSQENDQERDDIFARRGRVWWDAACP